MGVTKVKAKKRWVIAQYPKQYVSGRGYSGDRCQRVAVFPGFIYDSKVEALEDARKLRGTYSIRGTFGVVEYKEEKSDGKPGWTF